MNFLIIGIIVVLGIAFTVWNNKREKGNSNNDRFRSGYKVGPKAPPKDQFGDDGEYDSDDGEEEARERDDDDRRRYS